MNVLIDRMTRLDRSSRYAVYAAMLIISGVAMYGQIVSPHVQYLKAVQDYEPAIDQMIDEQVEISKKLVGRRKTLAELKTKFEAIGFTVFSPEKMKEFLAGLEQVAGDFKCSIAQTDSSEDKSKVIIGEATDPSYVEAVQMTLSVLGEFNQLMLFIDSLQNRERQIWLTSVDIEKVQGQDRVLKCDITIRLYVLQENKLEAVL